jgi:hypothetical protein
MDIVKQFDSLPDDAVIPRRVAAQILNLSERTIRRLYPVVKLSPNRRGVRVGDIRAIARGQPPKAA